MISVDELAAAVQAGIEPLAALELSLLDSFGCTLADDVVAEVALPLADQAALDGYAAVSADLRSAGPGSPVVLPVGGDVPVTAGGVDSLPSGQVLRVSSGALIPAGADCVVAAADTDGGVAQVSIERAAVPGENIRPAGADVAGGEVALPAGTRLGAAQVGLLAALGLARVSARPRPRVVILATGNELIEPGERLIPGRQRDVDTYLLTTAAIQAGATVFAAGVSPDEPRTLLDAVDDQLVRADLVVVTGGVSDRPGEVLRAAYGRHPGVSFVDVAIAPGTSYAYGKVGSDDIPFIALPGSPVAAYVGFEVFVRPVIRRMLAADPILRPTVRASLTDSLPATPGRRGFWPAHLDVVDGRYVVTPLPGRGTHQVSAMARSNSLLDVPADAGALAAGDAVTVVVLERRTG
jgi:molybdopterin molybdotransferase